MDRIYLDNAATSFPKPPSVTAAMVQYMTGIGASLNRGDYERAQKVGETALSLREKLCRLFHHDDPRTCILTPGHTYGLNQVIVGYLKPGDHCLVSALEHNAVLRPLQALSGVTFDRIPVDEQGRLRLEEIPRLIRPHTRLLVLSHASNVCGTVQDAAAVGALCQAYGIPFLLDAAQTAGHWPVNSKAIGLSALSVPGHKGLMGPAGIGALLLREDFAACLTPLTYGGTGSFSESEEQPFYMPDRLESGTPNLPGIYGLSSAVDFILDTGVDVLQAHETALTARFLAGLTDIPGIRLVGSWETVSRVGVLSLDFSPLDNGEVAYRLERDYGILTRCGLHCAGSAHKALGSFPGGTVRFSLGWYNTEQDVDAALRGIRETTALSASR